MYLDDCSGNRSCDNFFIVIIFLNDIFVNMYVVRGFCYVDYIIYVFMDEFFVFVMILLYI